MDCPTTEALERHLLDGRPEDELARHVAACGACAETLARIEENNRFLDDLRGSYELPAATDARPLIPGYRIVGEIHRGGQGVVYRAVQLATKRTVAVKLLLDGALATPARRRRFEREIEIVAALEHPSIVTVYDSGALPDGRHYLVMEYVDGVPLDRSPAPGTAAREALVRRFVEVCDAVNHAHQRGVIHRDLKPSNVLVDAEGRAHVLDFGSAKGLGAAGDEAPLTVTGAFLGTLAYASPEQVGGAPERVDIRTDVYSLGVMLYQLVAGRLPYPIDGTPRAVLRAIVEREPEPITERIGRDLETIVHKALAKEPERRYQTAGELGRDLERYLDGEPIDARRDSSWYVIAKTLRRHRLRAAAGALVAVVVVVASIVSAVFGRRAVLAAELARSRADAVMRLSDARRLEALERSADELWPSHPDHIEAYERWLADARELASRRASHAATLAAMRAEAEPWSEADRELDRAGDPSAATLADRLLELGYVGDQIRSVEADSEADGANPRRERLRERSARLEQEVAALEAEASRRRTYRFADAERAWWHDALTQLVADLDAFFDEDSGRVVDVERRLAFAREVGERSVSGPVAARLWERAIASIADRDECPAYGGLELGPQVGLLPIGRDPDSGLWEFAHLRTGAVCERDPGSGHLRFDEASGLVFVLLPGGTFAMGAQPDDPDGPNHDPLAVAAEGPVHEVTLAPFFLSKFEMTMGQWERFTGSNPSLYPPPLAPGGVERTLAHPVENLTWTAATGVLRHLGLALPTEAQWEYGARGGTSTPWWTGAGRESLAGAINVADQSAARAGAHWPQVDDWPGFDDGSPLHAPVDRYRPNPFGLHNVHGNVSEWCLDADGDYSRAVRAGDGLRVIWDTGLRIYRGGSYLHSAGRCRSADRNRVPPSYASSSLGLRPARRVDPGRG